MTVSPTTCNLKRLTVAIVCALMLLPTVGCNQPEEAPTPVLKPASLATRAQRRAYDGAPPVIAHESFGAACITCHTRDGKQIPTVGVAPANPHWGDPRDGAFSMCTQCHVFARTDEVFTDSDFNGLRQVAVPAERAYPGAPPVIPHSLSMRNNCNACHTPASQHVQRFAVLTHSAAIAYNVIWQCNPTVT